jgi:hypothetical protein
MRIFLVFVLLVNFACTDPSKSEIGQETVRECDPYLDCKPVIPINFEQKSTRFVSQMNVNVLVSDLAKENKIESKTVGFSGDRSTIYSKYQLLKLIADQESLVLLLDHEAANVRYYSYVSLVSLDSSRKDDYFRQVRGKYDSIDVLDGCIGGDYPLFHMLQYPIREYDEDFNF